MIASRTIVATALALSLGALSTGMAGCQRPELTGPPELRLGRDQCIECGMIINEDRFSSASLIDAEGCREHRLFDDVGCMLDYHRERPQITLLEVFAHDADTRTWLAAHDAVFLLTDDGAVLTPMGSGIAAYAGRPAAEAAQREFGGRMLTYAELAAPRQAWVEARMGRRQDGSR